MALKNRGNRRNIKKIIKPPYREAAPILILLPPRQWKLKKRVSLIRGREL